MNDPLNPPAVVEKQDVTRIQYVRQEIEAINRSVTDGSFEIAMLLSEAKAEDYPFQWGYNSFADYLKDSSLDLSEREAYYRIKIIDVGHKKLGISQEDLRNAWKVSHLKEIFTLNSETFGSQIKSLVQQVANGATLDTIKNAVAELKRQNGEEVFVYRHFKLQKNVAEGVIDTAIETAKRMRGSTMDPETKELKDPSNGQALEDVCADFNAGIGEHMQAELDAMPEDEPET